MIPTEDPLKVTLTVCDVIPDPAATLKTGFWLTAKPNPPPPVPTFRLTGKLNEPLVVLTKTVPEYVPVVRKFGVTPTVTNEPEGLA